MTEPVTTISGAVTKALSAVKDFPLWLLTAIALSLTAFRSVPEFNGAVPQETRAWITVAAKRRGRPTRSMGEVDPVPGP
jgi:hypothetical protein